MANEIPFGCLVSKTSRELAQNEKKYNKNKTVQIWVRIITLYENENNEP